MMLTDELNRCGSVSISDLALAQPGASSPSIGYKEALRFIKKTLMLSNLNLWVVPFHYIGNKNKKNIHT